MKTLIVYGTKYGYTKSCADDLKHMMKGEVEAVNAAKAKIKNFDEYDKVIMGGSIYMGIPNKHIKAFTKKNADKLQGKKIGLFICCAGVDKFQESLAKTFPVSLIENAVSTECFGGVMNKENMSGFHKKIAEMVEQDENNPPPVALPENIKKMAAALNSEVGQ